MSKEQNKKNIKKYEAAVKKAAKEKYVLRLFVTGTTPRSLQAIETIKKICEENLQGRYNLEIIDIYQQPKLAEGDQIIAVPTLLKVLPTPLRRFIGDLSNTERILLGLDLKKRE
jgi:circadian clock protein KaiB